MHPGLGWALAPSPTLVPRTAGVFLHEMLDTRRSVLEPRSTATTRQRRASMGSTSTRERSQHDIQVILVAGLNNGSCITAC
jgi:hypothetical protein